MQISWIDCRLSTAVSVDRQPTDSEAANASRRRPNAERTDSCEARGNWSTVESDRGVKAVAIVVNDNTYYRLSNDWITCYQTVILLALV